MSNHAETNLRDLIDCTKEILWSVDSEFRLIAFNRALSQSIAIISGAETRAGMSFYNLLPAELAVLWPPLYERALKEGAFQEELTLFGRLTLELSFCPIPLEGAEMGVSVLAKNISDTKNEQKSPALAEVQYKKIFDEARNGMFLTTIDGTPLTVNRAMVKMLGYESDDELITASAGQMKGLWSDHAEHPALLKELYEQGHVQLAEYKFRRKDGSSFFGILSCKLIYAADENQPMIECVVEDVPERKQVEKRLRDNEAWYSATFEQNALGIVHYCIDGRCIRSNNRFAQIVGYPAEEISSLTITDLTLPDDLGRSREILKRLAGGATDPIHWEKCFLHKDGSRVWALLTTLQQFDDDENLRHLISFVVDISGQKAAEEQLAETIEVLRVSETRYRTAFQTSLDSICITRMDDGTVIDVNDMFIDFLGYSRQDLTEQTVTVPNRWVDLNGEAHEDLFLDVKGQTTLGLNLWANPSDRERFVEILTKDAICRNFETQWRHRSGALLWVQISASLVELEAVQCSLTVIRDITEAKAAERRIALSAEARRQSDQRYRTAFQTSLDAITITRISDAAIVDINQAFLDISGYEREEVIGRTTLELGIWADARDRDYLTNTLSDHSIIRDLEARFRRKNGEIFWGRLSVSIIELNGAPCMLFVSRDISGIKAAEEEIHSLAYYDPLTELPNRKLLLEQLQKMLNIKSQRHLNKALLYVDLDNFQVLNDTLGHSVGDLVLQEAAHRIRECLHKSHMVARLGGDEFVVILDGISPILDKAAIQARLASESIKTSLGKAYQHGDRHYLGTASIGIKIFGDEEQHAEVLLQQAGIALGHAKSDGRNAIRFFEPDLQEAVNARAAIEEDLRFAIEAGDLMLYYQPQMDCEGLTGAEALVRWNHPVRGFISPGEFISIAENSGLIIPLGDFVLESACRQVAEWKAHQQIDGLTFAVNISARQFRQTGFVEKVMAIIARTGADPRNIELELTESLFIENVEDIIAKMTALKKHGVRFSLDDFGTGYSSLMYLKQMPLDKLKIDLSFVRDILVDANSGAIADAIISLSRTMGLSVIAEGVETEAQKAYLIEHGCHNFQGFLFSKPLPVADFERLLQTSISEKL
jgi:diguanylate cyclase (GGDEF)-like protein/PAS domain S-box-containing protein